MARESREAAESVLGMDRVRWGPIVAGVLVTLAVLLVLSVLGLAIGLAVFEPDEAGTRTFGTAAAIWGIITTLLAFAVGGWWAAYTSGTSGTINGIINGLMVGVASIVLLVWFVGLGVGNLLGAVAGNLDAVMQVGQDVADADPSAAYDEARTNSWISLVGLLLALAAAAVGGFVGHREPETVYAPATAHADTNPPAHT